MNPIAIFFALACVCLILGSHLEPYEDLLVFLACMFGVLTVLAILAAWDKERK